VRRARVARGPRAERTETSKEVRPIVRGPRMAGVTKMPKEVRLARVVRGPQRAEATETPILIEVGHTRIGVRRGFDVASLRIVLDILGGSR
jgi:hypothetical protein